MTEAEIADTLAIYIMAFGGLDYKITLHALNKIMFDEGLMKEFRSSPIPTLARESTRMTQFSEEEKRKYRELQNIEYFHDPLHKGIMFAANARNWKAMPEHNRKMTPLEEDYYDNSLMSKEEYYYWKWGKDKGEKRPPLMLYDPVTRTKKKNNMVQNGN